ncbi:putative exonuclease V [Lachnellula suecica]|uniref:Putative exonuclease V n=1 Tax=Lachnellula suecica TaxID=602035 RepID=A0A8T9BT30_9HELO|nr:putative exonuclease V [Lachnellula suecica]
MASPAIIPDTLAPPLNDLESDYGSDFSPEEELIVEALLSQQQLRDDNPIITDIEDEPRQALRLPRVVGREERSALFQAARAAEQIAEQISNSVKTREYPDLYKQKNDLNPKVPEIIPIGPQLPDNRSPLERFRTPPKKGLSVTDLVSPAWCQLQYWYTLTIHGKKKRTPEMKQGSIVHKKLEDQVHTTVRVEVATKEDAWGLRIWNVIQGLKTLRDTGLTRELEVWGTIDGLVVTGIIDELSYTCPDTELEASLKTRTGQDEPPPDQTTISDFFKAGGGRSIGEATRSKNRSPSYKVYIGDVKTRSVKTLPSNSAFRPTRMQLQIYHHLLSKLATNTVDFSVFTQRYNLDPNKVFSDAFLAQVGSLNDEFSQEVPDGDQESPPISSQDSMTTLLSHNTLSALWNLMISEFQITLPDGADSLGQVLKVEYRSRDTADIVGSKAFAVNEESLKGYLDSELQWWRGEREAKGVAVHEAYKCRSCDFAETCEWRLKKVEEAQEKARMTRKRSAAV